MRLALVIGVASVAACGTEPPPEVVPAPRFTWYQDVGPMVAKRCTSCHQAGGIGPFDLTKYSEAFEQGTEMVTEVTAQRMPPWDAREEASCTPRFGWKDDPRPTSAEKAMLAEWVTDGMPMGDEVALPVPPSTALAGVTKTLAPVEPFTTSGTRDQFYCFIFDPGITEVAWLTGMQVRPDNELVVHHAVITELQAGTDQDALVAQHGIGKPFDCSTMVTPGQFVMNIWTPGNQPMQTQAELAVPILAGAKIVMQIHYHPAGMINAPDATELDLRISPTWPTKMYFVTALGNATDAAAGLEVQPDETAAEFMIPRDATDHVESMSFTLPTVDGDVRLFSANPHMHLVGTHIESTITRAAPSADQPREECLANGAWNFDWQRTYIYNTDLDHLPKVTTGDTISVKCHWNNTLQNPFVVRMLEDAGMPGHNPIDITLGEQTTNEMCLEIFGITVAAPAEPVSRTTPVTITLPRIGGIPNLAAFAR